jgi:hypothetical protein
MLAAALAHASAVVVAGTRALVAGMAVYQDNDWALHPWQVRTDRQGARVGGWAACDRASATQSDDGSCHTARASSVGLCLRAARRLGCRAGVDVFGEVLPPFCSILHVGACRTSSWTACRGSCRTCS